MAQSSNTGNVMGPDTGSVANSTASGNLVTGEESSATIVTGNPRAQRAAQMQAEASKQASSQDAQAEEKAVGQAEEKPETTEPTEAEAEPKKGPASEDKSSSADPEPAPEETPAAESDGAKSAAGEEKPASELSEKPTDEEPKKSKTLAEARRERLRLKHESDEWERRKEEAKKSSNKMLLQGALICVVVVIILLGVGFCLQRWVMPNDAQAFQGKWQVQGTNATITITDSKIVLTNDVTYDYTINPSDKTINIKFGNMGGNSRYRFSFDGNMLALEDGKYDFMSTVMQDIPWTAMAALTNITGNVTSPKISDTSTVLVRVQEQPAAQDQAAQQAADQQAQQQQAEQQAQEQAS